MVIVIAWAMEPKSNKVKFDFCSQIFTNWLNDLEQDTWLLDLFFLHSKDTLGLSIFEGDSKLARVDQTEVCDPPHYSCFNQIRLIVVE